jgi:hypothetical protein
MERKITPKGQSYWGGNGAYSKEMHELWEKLVPVEGEADTLHGELIRCINRLTYDFGNNGNGNVIKVIEEDCPECHGSGWQERRSRYRDSDEDEEEDDCGGDCKIETGKEFDRYFGEMFEYLKNNLPKAEQPLLDDLEAYILKDKLPDGLDDFQVYDRVNDAVMYFVLTTENKKR